MGSVNESSQNCRLEENIGGWPGAIVANGSCDLVGYAWRGMRSDGLGGAYVCVDGKPFSSGGSYSAGKLGAGDAMVHECIHAAI